MAHFRETHKKGFSQKVSEILLSSWRKKTASQYESAWKASNSWCSEWEINLFSTTLENILEFLADLFHKGFKFHTLGVYVNMDLAFLLDYLYLVTVAHHQTPYGCEEEFVPASVRGST